MLLPGIHNFADHGLHLASFDDKTFEANIIAPSADSRYYIRH